MNETKTHKSKSLPFTELEKNVLKHKMLKTLNDITKRKRASKIAICTFVCVIFLGGFGFYFLNTPKTSITEFVNSSKNIDINQTEDVVLILGEGKNLNIQDKNSTINYSNTGKKITIGNYKQVNQETSKNNKTLFNTILVPYGKRTKMKLSDGSVVWLNSGSKLIYPSVFNGNKRELYLEGEAIFDVAHNESKPFIVISQNQEIEVLGTVFGVTSYSDENIINTVLKSGSVQISYHNDGSSKLNLDKMKISPGTMASYNKKSAGIISEKVNVDYYFSWRDGVLVFKNNDLRYIMNRLSRYYNIEIEISNAILSRASSETFSGYLDLNENINKVIENIKESTNMNYEFAENKILIN